MSLLRMCEFQWPIVSCAHVLDICSSMYRPQAFMPYLVKRSFAPVCVFQRFHSDVQTFQKECGNGNWLGKKTGNQNAFGDFGESDHV